MAIVDLQVVLKPSTISHSAESGKRIKTYKTEHQSGSPHDYKDTFRPPAGIRGPKKNPQLPKLRTEFCS